MVTPDGHSYFRGDRVCGFLSGNDAAWKQRDFRRDLRCLLLRFSHRGTGRLRRSSAWRRHDARGQLFGACCDNGRREDLENGLAVAGVPFPENDFQALADVNGDGNIDLIRLTAAGVVEVLRGNGDGTFQPPLISGTASQGMLLVGDFNGDGKPDLVIGGDTVSLSAR